jgi:hypothetical protein
MTGAGGKNDHTLTTPSFQQSASTADDAIVADLSAGEENNKGASHPRWFRRYGHGLDHSNLNEEEKHRARELILALRWRDSRATISLILFIGSVWVLSLFSSYTTEVVSNQMRTPSLFDYDITRIVAIIALSLTLYFIGTAPLRHRYYLAVIPSDVGYILICILIYGASFYGFLQTAQRKHSYILLGLAYASIIALYTIILALAFLVAYTSWRRHADRRAMEKRPQNVVVGALVEVIGICEKDWDDLKKRGRALILLEQAANSVQHGLSYSMRAYDFDTHAWLLKETEKRAESIRNLKRLICLSSPESRKSLIEQCHTLLRRVLEGNWKDLPTVELPVASSVMPWTVRLGQLARQLLNAFLPLLILFGLQALDVPLKEPAAPYLWAGAVAWALIGVILALDPTAREKGNFAKDMAEAVKNLRPGS